MQEATEASGWAQELVGEGHTSEVDEYGFHSHVYTATLPFHPGRLLQFVESLPGECEPLANSNWNDIMTGMLRSKGFFWLACLPNVRSNTLLPRVRTWLGIP